MNLPVLKNTSACHLLGIALFFCFFTILPACKVKEGCPTKGFTNTMESTTKHGKSNLFDKKMRKKVKK